MVIEKNLTTEVIKLKMKEAQENKKTSHRLEENICKRYIYLIKKTVTQNIQRTLETHK